MGRAEMRIFPAPGAGATSARLKIDGAEQPRWVRGAPALAGACGEDIRKLQHHEHTYVQSQDSCNRSVAAPLNGDVDDVLCRWRFFLHELRNGHWVSTARGPPEVIVDAWGVGEAHICHVVRP
jgi:hypothetical protein